MKFLFARAALPIGLLGLAHVALAQIQIQVSIVPKTARPGDSVTYSVTTEEGADCYPAVGARSGGDTVPDLSNVHKPGPAPQWTFKVPVIQRVPVTWTIGVTCSKPGANTAGPKIKFPVASQ
jgi:hypothetical protein